MNPVSELGKRRSSDAHCRTIPPITFAQRSAVSIHRYHLSSNSDVEIHFPSNPSSAIPVPLPIDPRSGRSTRLHPSHETDLPKPSSTSSTRTPPLILPIQAIFSPSTFPDSLTCERFRREPVQLVGEKDHVESIGIESVWCSESSSQCGRMSHIWIFLFALVLWTKTVL